MRRPDDGPGPLAWLLAFIGMGLPWAGAALALIGVCLIAWQAAGGWWYLAAGGGLLVANVLLDLAWTRPSASSTDEPDLNRRPAQFVGRLVVVEEAIDHGRGKVRVGDTLWPVEGPDTPAGTLVRVKDARGAVLVIEPAQEARR